MAAYLAALCGDYLFINIDQNTLNTIAQQHVQIVCVIAAFLCITFFKNIYEALTVIDRTKEQFNLIFASWLDYTSIFLLFLYCILWGLPNFEAEYNSNWVIPLAFLTYIIGFPQAPSFFGFIKRSPRFFMALLLFQLFLIILPLGIEATEVSFLEKLIISGIGVSFVLSFTPWESIVHFLISIMKITIGIFSWLKQVLTERSLASTLGKKIVENENQEIQAIGILITSILNYTIQSILRLITFPLRRQNIFPSQIQKNAEKAIYQLWAIGPGISTKDQAIRSMKKYILKNMGDEGHHISKGGSYHAVDYLNRQPFVDSLYKLLRPEINRGFKDSFTLAINGKWGDGKTWVVDKLFEKIQTEHQNTICIPIYPSTYLSCGDFETFLSGLYKDIFTEINKTYYLQDFNSNIHQLFSSFTEQISHSPIPYKGLISFVTGSNALTGWEYRKNLVSDALSKYNLRLIISLEDLDRLNTEEFLSILKFVRQAFDMSNVIFILPIDKAALLQPLEDKKLPSEYLEKFIQVEKYLPPIYTEQIKQYLLTEFEDRFYDNPDYKTYKVKQQLLELFEVNSFLEEVTNIRKADRLLNSAIPTITSLISEISVADYLELEIIKINYPAIYENIISNPIYYLYTFTKEERTLDQFLKDSDIKGIKPSTIDLVKDLFPNIQAYGDEYGVGRERRLYSISDSNYYQRYFEENVPSNELKNLEVKLAISKILRDPLRTREVLDSTLQRHKLTDFLRIFEQMCGAPQYQEAIPLIAQELVINYNLYNKTNKSYWSLASSICDLITKSSAPIKLLEDLITTEYYIATMIIHFIDLSLEKGRLPHMEPYKSEFDQLKITVLSDIEKAITHKEEDLINCSQDQLDIILFFSHRWNVNIPDFEKHFISLITTDKGLNKFLEIFINNDNSEIFGEYKYERLKLLKKMPRLLNKLEAINKKNNNKLLKNILTYLNNLEKNPT